MKSLRSGIAIVATNEMKITAGISVYTRIDRLRLKWLVLLALLLSVSMTVSAQDERPYYVVQAVVIDGDTIPMVMLQEFSISERRTAKSRKYQRRYGKIKKKVLKAYPYAEVTRDLLAEFDTELAAIEGDRDRQKYMDKAEDELKEEFEGELKELTMSEGRILIKLIDRETGETSFELVKRLKGNFNAYMWQGVAKVFGSDLKSEYDPEGDDAIIEDIIQAIERGDILVPDREPATTKAQKRLKKKAKREKEKAAKKAAKDAKKAVK